jgi:hypothetical protein
MIKRMQRTHRSARLMPGVAMTSNVKSWLPSYYMFFLLVTLGIARAGASMRRRLILLMCVG